MTQEKAALASVHPPEPTVPNGFAFVSRNDLRRLVDIVWGHAYEDESVPATSTADELIDRALKQDAPPASVHPVPAPEAFVRHLLWGLHPECCGNMQFDSNTLGGERCCGKPDMADLNDAQIVASLRERFPAHPVAPAPSQPKKETP